MDQRLPAGWVCSVPTARASHLFFLLTMAIMTTMAANMESSSELGDTVHQQQETLIRLARFQPDPTDSRAFIVSPAVFRRGAFSAADESSAGSSTLMLVRRDGMVIRRHRRAVTSSANGVSRSKNNKRNPIVIGGGRIPHALQQKFAALAAKNAGNKHQQDENIRVVAAGDPGVPQQLTNEPDSAGNKGQEEVNTPRKQEPEKVINGKNGPVKLKVPNSAGRPYLDLDEDHIGLKNTAFSPVQKNPAMSNRADSGSSINDLDDFMSAMKAGQKMWKEKVMKSGSAVKTGGSAGHAIASKFSSSRGSSSANHRVIPSKVAFGRNNNGMRGLSVGGSSRIKREAGFLKRRRRSPHRIPLNPVVRKVRQGVYGLNRMRPLQGNVGTPNMRGPIDFPGAPNYVPSLPNRRVGAPRGPYTTPAYGPKPPPPVASRMNQQQTMNNDVEHPMLDDYAEEDFDAGSVYRAPGRVAITAGQQPPPQQQQQEEAPFGQQQQPKPSLKQPQGGRLFQQHLPHEQDHQMMVDEGMAPGPLPPLGNIGGLNKFRPMKQMPHQQQRVAAGAGMTQNQHQQQHGHPSTGDVTDVSTGGLPSRDGDVQQRYMAPGLDRKPEYPGLVARQTAGDDAAGQRSRSEGNQNNRHHEDFADEGEPGAVADDYVPTRTRVSSLRKAPLGTGYVSLRDREAAAAEQEQLDNRHGHQQQIDRVADDMAGDYQQQEDVIDNPAVVAAEEEDHQQQARQQKERLGAGLPTGMWRKPMDNPASMSMARRFGLEWGRRSTLLNMPMQVHQGMMPLAKLNG